MLPEERESILDAQNHRCNICNAPFSGDVPYAIDHHKQSGIIRGILCTRCNSQLLPGFDKVSQSEQLEYAERVKTYLV